VRHSGSFILEILLWMSRKHLDVLLVEHCFRVEQPILL
jgi:hypothetical protein